MKTPLLFGLTLLLSAASAHAGASNASVNCVSASGKTKLAAWSMVDDPEESMTLTLDAGSAKPTITHWINQSMVDLLTENHEDPAVKYPGYKLAATRTINEISLNVYAMDATVAGEYLGVRLVANPTTMRVKRSREGSEKRTFSAILRATDPRPNSNRNLEVKMTCNWEYSL
jgi:hypothetical protein